MGGDDVVELNVGGELMATSRSTLLHNKESMLFKMFSGDWDNNLMRDSQGRVFLDFDPDCFRIILRYLRECKLTGPDEEVEVPITGPAGRDAYYRKLVRYLLMHELLVSPDKFSRTLKTENIKVSDNSLTIVHVGSEMTAEDIVGTRTYVIGEDVEFHIRIDYMPEGHGQLMTLGIMDSGETAKFFAALTDRTDSATSALPKSEYGSLYGWVYQHLGSSQQVVYRSEGGKGFSRTREPASWKAGDEIKMTLSSTDNRQSLTMSVNGTEHYAPITNIRAACKSGWCLRVRMRHPGTQLTLARVANASGP